MEIKRLIIDCNIYLETSNREVTLECVVRKGAMTERMKMGDVDVWEVWGEETLVPEVEMRRDCRMLWEKGELMEQGVVMGEGKEL